MQRLLLLASICLWTVFLVGCGGDEPEEVAGNTPSPSADGQNPDGQGGGGSESDGGGADASMSVDSEGGYPEGYGEESGGDGYGENYEEEMGSSEEEYEEAYGENYEEGMSSSEEEYEEAYGENYEEGMSSSEEEYEEAYGENYEEEMGSSEEEYGEAYGENYEEGMEYGGEEGYGSGYPGGEGGRGPGRPGAKPAKPLTLLETAQAAFRQGKDREAFQYLYGHALTSDDQAATELLGKMGLLVPAKRPALAVRWGVGVALTTPSGLNPYPIGTTQSQVGSSGGSRFSPQSGPSVGGGRRGGGGGEMGMGEPQMGEPQMGSPQMGEPGMGLAESPRPFGDSGAPDGPAAGGGPATARGGPIDPNLQKVTGELGQRVVDGLRQRIAQGDFGQVLVMAASAPSRSRGGGGYGGSSEYGSGYGSSEESEYGSGYDSGEGGGYGGGYGQSTPRGGQQKGPSQLAPGAIMLGVGGIKELKVVAAQYEIDALCVFNVNVKPNLKLGTSINETSIAIYNMTDGKEVFETKKLNNIAVQVARQGGKPDGVDKEIDDLFEYVDSAWKLAPMPALNEEGVLARLRPVITEPQENPLPILAEIRMYKTQGLLNDQFFAIAYKSVLGDQKAALLATGTEDQKKEAISQWLPTQ